MESECKCGKPVVNVHRDAKVSSEPLSSASFARTPFQPQLISPPSPLRLNVPEPPTYTCKQPISVCASSREDGTHLVSNGTTNGNIDLKMLVVPVGALHTVELVGVADDDILLVFVGKAIADVLHSVGTCGIIGSVATEDGVDQLRNAACDVGLLAFVDGLEGALVGWVEVAIVEAAGILSVSSRTGCGKRLTLHSRRFRQCIRQSHRSESLDR